MESDRLPEERAALGKLLFERLDAQALSHPESTEPLSWEALKAQTEKDRR